MIGEIVGGASGQDVDGAAKEIQELLKKQKVDNVLLPNEEFDPSSFDPEKFDPLMLESSWEFVRLPVCEIMKRRLKLEFISEDALNLYIGQVSETPVRCQMLFVEHDGSVREALSRGMQYPAVCVPKNWRITAQTRAVVTSTDIKWEDMGNVTSEFAGASRELKKLEFSVQPPVYFKDKVQVITGWRKFGQYGGYDMMWRVFFQVKKSDEDGVYIITVRGQVARNLPGAAINQAVFMGSEESDSRYEVRIGTTSVSQKRSFISINGDAGPYPDYPAAFSTSGKLVQQLLDEFIAKLTGRPNGR